MKISNKIKLSKVQSIIVFTILVSIAMSGIMSFGLLLYSARDKKVIC